MTLHETPGTERRSMARGPLFWSAAVVALLALLTATGLGILWWAGVVPGGGAEVSESAGLYHCPMHPTVVQDEPGDCPICGMHLVEVEEESSSPRAGGMDQKALWQCPMHPTIVQDHPGDCPICSMRLVEAEPAPSGAGERGATLAESVEGYTPVQIPGARRQLIGVRTSEVAPVDLTHSIRTVGEVEPDETRVRHIHTKIEGWIEDLYVDFTGKRVRRGDPLLSIYSPELLVTQEEYLLALRGRERLGDSPFEEVAGGAASLVDATRRRLVLWDIPEDEIRRIEETGEPLRAVTLRSPIPGWVLHKNAVEGMRVEPGMELFTIADLSSVWVLADIYEYELPLVEVGQEARLTISSYPGEMFHGTVDFLYPTLDRKTRTAKVRFRFANLDLDLKPGMYANVSLDIPLGERLAVPEEAVIDTGTRQLVFLALEDGWFAPTEIQVGRKAEGLYEVVAGLDPGDRVVTNGTFMIDSESRLKASISRAASRSSNSSSADGSAAGHQH